MTASAEPTQRVLSGPQQTSLKRDMTHSPHSQVTRLDLTCANSTFRSKTSFNVIEAVSIQHFLQRLLLEQLHSSGQRVIIVLPRKQTSSCVFFFLWSIYSTPNTSKQQFSFFKWANPRRPGMYVPGADTARPASRKTHCGSLHQHLITTVLMVQSHWRKWNLNRNSLYDGHTFYRRCILVSTDKWIISVFQRWVLFRCRKRAIQNIIVHFCRTYSDILLLYLWMTEMLMVSTLDLTDNTTGQFYLMIH